MFVATATAQRIERAEVETMRAMVAPHVASQRAPDAFVRALDGGVAAFVRAGSPMNKVIGVGLAAPLAEEGPPARDERVRVARMTDATVAAWKAALVDGFAASDDSGVPVDVHTR